MKLFARSGFEDERASSEALKRWQAWIDQPHLATATLIDPGPTFASGGGY